MLTTLLWLNKNNFLYFQISSLHKKLAIIHLKKTNAIFRPIFLKINNLFEKMREGRILN